MASATDYYYTCGNSLAVTARFYSDGKLAKEERFQAQSRCEIQLPAEGCPRVRAAQRIFNDNWDNAGADPDRCLRRAAEYQGYCEAKSPVRARFFSGGVVVKEKLSDKP